jgi:sugar/nucleoside kinase (ribokinase family)
MTPGACHYLAVAFHRLGVRAGWDVHIGNDPLSRVFLETIRREGLDDSLIHVHEFPIISVTASLSFPNDRAFVSYADEPPVTPLLSLIDRYPPRLLLFPGLNSGLHALDALPIIRERGVKTYLDCGMNEATLGDPDIVTLLQSVDVFAPNEREALALTGASHVEAALAMLAELTDLVIIKLGPQGAIAQTHSEIIHVPALRIETLDTTGAGDIFNTGFIYGYLSDEPLERCLMYGNICGGLSTRGYGAHYAPTLSEINESMAYYA